MLQLIIFFVIDNIFVYASIAQIKSRTSKVIEIQPKHLIYY